jgi:hypothetical protein
LSCSFAESNYSNKYKMKTLLRTFTLFIAVLSFSNIQAADIVITDDGSGTGTTTWTADNNYILDGLVFVNSGQALTIEAGTVVKGMAGTGADASALVVARGGQLFANGTDIAPIIFTFENDPLDGSTPWDTRGQWGGLIVLGDAILNSTPGESQVEGIPDTEARGLYGGENDNDNSGSITYISIRHGGTDIGAGNEINGLTLGGVGAETVIEHVEVVSNADDGIEFFGGTVSIKWAVVAFCGDDSFDYDEGWRGRGQFWFTAQDSSNGEGDRGGEHDGGTNPEDGEPYAHPVIYNVTYVGLGIAAGKRALTFRDNAAGEYHNGVFVNWGKGIDVENLASGEDSYERLAAGELAFAGNCFYNTASDGLGATASDLFKISMGSGWASDADSTAALTASTDALVATFTANGNDVGNPMIETLIEEGSNGLVPVPSATLPTVTPSSDDWYTSATYKGAFDPTSSCSWLTGWTFLDSRGFIGCTNNIEEGVIADTALNIFPNPTSGNITVTLPEAVSNGQLNILDLTGRVVATQQLVALPAGSFVQLDMNNFENGIYLVQFNQGQVTRTARVVLR